jgi:hypothetical protein
MYNMRPQWRVSAVFQNKTGNSKRVYLETIMKYTFFSISVLIDLSRIRFSENETMVPSRGWTWCFSYIYCILSSSTSNCNHCFVVTEANSGMVYWLLMHGFEVKHFVKRLYILIFFCSIEASRNTASRTSPATTHRAKKLTRWISSGA